MYDKFATMKGGKGGREGGRAGGREGGRDGGRAGEREGGREGGRSFEAERKHEYSGPRMCTTRRQCRRAKG